MHDEYQNNWLPFIKLIELAQLWCPLCAIEKRWTKCDGPKHEFISLLQKRRTIQRVNTRSISKQVQEIQTNTFKQTNDGYSVLGRQGNFIDGFLGNRDTVTSEVYCKPPIILGDQSKTKSSPKMFSCTITHGPKLHHAQRRYSGNSVGIFSTTPVTTQN